MGRVETFKAIRWLFLALLVLIFWMLGISFSFRCSGRPIHYPTSACSPADFNSDFDGLTQFACTAFDADHDSRPVHSICFENLRCESGNLGWFKTGVHQTVRITGLRLRLHSYSVDADPDLHTAPADVTNSESLLDTIRSVSGLTSDVGGGQNSDSRPTLRIDMPIFNLRNVTELRVRDFDYAAFHDGGRVIEVASRLAQVSGGVEEVVLRGNVVITAASGDTLQSNNVCWNRSRQCFEAVNGYVLRRGGATVSGKDILVDVQLNNIHSQRASLR